MNQTRACAKCDRVLPPGAPDGLCPACLIDVGLEELGLGVEVAPAGEFRKAVAGADGRAGDRPEAVSRGPTPSRRLGDYELLEPIGHGGMGVVYKARQVSLGRLVALKLLPFGQFAQREALERFRAEASAAAGLQHPNIVAVHEVGESEGQPYFSMDYVEGQTLADLVRDQPLPPRRAASYLQIIAEAVHHAHQHGILHRDLKPANVLVDALNQPRITDFGLAKRLPAGSGSASPTSDLTLTGQVLGSPHFMAPEQAQGRQQQIGPATDVYALGGLLYHLLTRHPPFQADTISSLLKLVTDTDPVPPRNLNASIPRDLETICLKCLEKDPARRYPSAAALARELHRFLEGLPIVARPVGTIGRSWKWCRRRPVLAGLCAALSVSVVAGVVAVLWQLRQTQRANEAAQRREYAANIATLPGLINGNQFGRAREILISRTPERYRSWEWGWLQRQCQQDLMTLAAGGLISVAFSPDAQFLAAGGIRPEGGSIPVFLYNAETGEKIRSFAGHTEGSGQCGFSPDGKHLASAGWGTRKVLVWEVATGRRVGTLEHPDAAYFVAYAPDGKKLATSCWDGKARVWDAENWQLLAESPPYDDEIYCADFSPDGRRVAFGGGYYRFASSRDTSVRIWDTVTGEVKRLEGHTELVMRTVWHPGGKMLASVGGEEQAILWDTDAGRKIASLHSRRGPGYLLNAAFSSDGRRLVVAGADMPSATARLEVFDVQEHRSLYTLDGHDNVICGVSFSRDGRIASAAFDGALKIWAADPAPAFLSFEGHDQAVWTLAFSPDGRLLATGGLDLTARIWSTADGALLQTLPVNYPVYALAFSPGGDRLLTVGPDHLAYVWNLADPAPGSSRLAPQELKGHRQHLLAVAWSSDDHWTATGGRDNQVILREAGTGRERRRLVGHTDAVLALAFAHGRPVLASGSEDGSVRLWNVQSGDCFRVLTNHGRPVISLAFSPDGQRLVSGGEDGYARIWDARDWRELRALQVSSGGPSGMAFSPDGRRLATAGGGRNLSANVGRESRIRLWDFELGLELLALFPHTNAVYGVAFSPDGRHLATASGDNTARLWTGFPWKNDDYPGMAREPLANRIEAFKRHRWRPAKQHPPKLARHLGFQPFGYFNLPEPGGKNQPVFPTPERDARATSDQINLAGSYNVALREIWQPLHWVHDTARCLEGLSPGLQTLGGVRFDVRGLVQLRRASPDCEPFPLRVSLPANRTFSRLHALHGARWQVRRDMPVAAFVLHYENNTQAEIPILYGRHLRQAQVEEDLTNECPEASLAWTSAPEVQLRSWDTRLYRATFENPHPERKVRDITYVSKMSQSAPFLVALTVE